jgi:hypothetical protein
VTTGGGSQDMMVKVSSHLTITWVSS